jgi:RNA recognition motif-containing protein
VNPQDRKQVFLGSLHYDATEAEIVSAFAGIGVLATNVRIPRDNDTGRAKGFAFVDIDPNATLTVEEIISGIDGVMFHGRPCRADKVNAKPERTQQPDRPARSERPDRNRRGGKGRDRDGSDW